MVSLYDACESGDIEVVRELLKDESVFRNKRVRMIKSDFFFYLFLPFRMSVV